MFPQLRGSPLAEHYRGGHGARHAVGLRAPLGGRAASGSRCASTRPRRGSAAYYRGIEERKAIEQEVVATKAELAATLAAITDGFYTLDREWRVTYLNDKAATVFPGGKEALGGDFRELFPDAAGSEFESNKRRAMELGEVRAFEAYYPAFDTWYEERDSKTDQ